MKLTVPRLRPEMWRWHPWASFNLEMNLSHLHRQVLIFISLFRVAKNHEPRHLWLLSRISLYYLTVVSHLHLMGLRHQNVLKRKNLRRIIPSALTSVIGISHLRTPAGVLAYLTNCTWAYSFWSSVSSEYVNYISMGRTPWWALGGCFLLALWHGKAHGLQFESRANPFELSRESRRSESEGEEVTGERQVSTEFIWSTVLSLMTAFRGLKRKQPGLLGAPSRLRLL